MKLIDVDSNDEFPSASKPRSSMPPSVPQNVDVELKCGKLDKLTRASLFPGCDYEILGYLLLQYEPLRLDVDARTPAIAP